MMDVKAFKSVIYNYIGCFKISCTYKRDYLMTKMLYVHL